MPPGEYYIQAHHPQYVVEYGKSLEGAKIVHPGPRIVWNLVPIVAAVVNTQVDSILETKIKIPRTLGAPAELAARLNDEKGE